MKRELFIMIFTNFYRFSACTVIISVHLLQLAGISFMFKSHQTPESISSTTNPHLILQGTSPITNSYLILQVTGPNSQTYENKVYLRVEVIPRENVREYHDY
jgi:hypothetical protein